MAVRIIVADDSVTVQKVLKLILVPQGYEVECFSTGAEALDSIRKNKPAVIFADAVMPGMNGIELGAKLQQSHKELQEVPLILMHSAFDEISPADVKESGAKAKLVKPFDDQQVVDLVEKLAIKTYTEPSSKETSTSEWNMDSFKEPDMPDMNEPLKTIKAGSESFDIDLTLAEPEADVEDEGFIKISETDKIDELGVPEPHEIEALRQPPAFQVEEPLSEESLSEHEAKKLFDAFNLAENPDGTIAFRDEQPPVPEFKPKTDNKVDASASVDPEKDMGLWSERFYGSMDDVTVPEVSNLSNGADFNLWDKTKNTEMANMEFEKAYGGAGQEVSNDVLQKITRETVERMLKQILPDIAEKVVREEISKIIGK